MAVPAGSGPSYPAGGYAPKPRVRFDAIGEGWQLFQQQSSTWVITTLVAMIIYLVIYFGFAFVVGAAMGAGANAAGRVGGTGALLGASLGSNVVLFAVSSVLQFFLMCGFYRMAAKQIRGEPIAIGDFFSVTDVIAGVVVGGILYGLLALCGVVALCVGAIVVGGLLMFAPLLVADRRLSGVDAISQSFNALKTDALMAILFYFVMSICIGISAIPCGLGLLVTIPMFSLAVTLMFRDFFPEAFPAAPYGGSPSGYPYGSAPTPGYPAPAESSYPAPAPGGYPAPAAPVAPAAPPPAPERLSETKIYPAQPAVEAPAMPPTPSAAPESPGAPPEPAAPPPVTPPEDKAG